MPSYSGHGLMVVKPRQAFEQRLARGSAESEVSSWSTRARTAIRRIQEQPWHDVQCGELPPHHGAAVSWTYLGMYVYGHGASGVVTCVVERHDGSHRLRGRNRGNLTRAVPDHDDELQVQVQMHGRNGRSSRARLPARRGWGRIGRRRPDRLDAARRCSARQTGPQSSSAAYKTNHGPRAPRSVRSCEMVPRRLPG